MPTIIGRNIVEGNLFAYVLNNNSLDVTAAGWTVRCSDFVAAKPVQHSLTTTTMANRRSDS